MDVDREEAYSDNEVEAESVSQAAVEARTAEDEDEDEDEEERPRARKRGRGRGRRGSAPPRRGRSRERGERAGKGRKRARREEKEEEEESDEEDKRPRSKKKTKGDDQDNLDREKEDQYKALVIQLEAGNNDPEYRALAEQWIKDVYIEYGGTPINASDPIPVDLSKYSSKDLARVMQNMKKFINQNEKDEVVSRCLNTLCNSAYLVSKNIGIPVQHNLFEAIRSDRMLSRALVQTFVGRASSLHPLLALAIATGNHATNLLVTLADQSMPTSVRKNTSQQPQQNVTVVGAQQPTVQTQTAQQQQGKEAGQQRSNPLPSNSSSSSTSNKTSV